MSLDPKRDRQSLPTAGGDELEAAPLSKKSLQDRLSLQTLDWASLGLIAFAIIFAPIFASNFSTAPRAQAGTPDDFETLMRSLGIPLLSIVISLALGLLLWREWKRPVAIGMIPGLSGAFALLGVWTVVSALAGNGTWLSLNAIMTLLTGLLAGGMISRLGRNPRGLALLLFAVILSGCVSAYFGISEYYSFYQAKDFGHRTFGTFLNENFLAGYLVLTLPITFCVYLCVKNRFVQLSAGVGLLMQSGCLMLTGSRAGVGVGALALVILMALTLATGNLKGRFLKVGLGIALLLIGAFLGRYPLLPRVAATENAGQPAQSVAIALKTTGEAQSHSFEFRKYNWLGTIKMATRNPILGTGIGTYSTTYSKYADTAFTFQAHNGFLQLAGETGFPGILLVLTGIAALTAFATHVVLKRDDPVAESVEDDLLGDLPILPVKQTLFDLDSPKLVLCGLLVSIAAILMHCLFDSDWYIGSTLLALSAVFGLASAFSRHLSPLATQAPRTLGREFTLIGLALIAFLLWRGNATLQSRLNLSAVSSSATIEAGLSSARAAASADSFDPEPHLLLSQLLAQSPSSSPADSLAELKKATELSPSGRNFYLLGKFYVGQKLWNEAETAFETSRLHDPNNLQTLKALAECFHASGKPTQAKEIYKTMTLLENGIYGKVRAIPELQEMDFTFAHAGLGEIAFESANWSEAATEYGVALKQLGQYWPGRDSYYNAIHSKEKKRTYQRLYLEVLAKMIETNKSLGKPELNAELQRTEEAVNLAVQE